MSSLNRVTLMGNLCRDPEIRSTQDGKEIATMTVATGESWKDKNTGDKKERTEFNRVVIFNDGLINIAKNHLKKGSKIYLEGSLQTRKWHDKDGKDKYSTETVLQGYSAVLKMIDSGAKAKDFTEPQEEAPEPCKPIDGEIPF